MLPIREDSKKKCNFSISAQLHSVTHGPRQNLRQQLQETDSLFQSTKAQQDEYLRRIASLEAERDLLKQKVAELEETTRDLYTHLATGR